MPVKFPAWVKPAADGLIAVGRQGAGTVVFSQIPPFQLRERYTKETKPADILDKELWKWTIHRSGTIGTLFSRVKKQTLLFPQV